MYIKQNDVTKVFWKSSIYKTRNVDESGQIKNFIFINPLLSELFLSSFFGI